MLPSWARSLITACSYVDELAGMNADTIWSANDLRANCNQMKKDAGDMLKARLVTVAPRAHEKALQRWPGKTGQWVKWIFCLTAAMVAAGQE